MERSRCPRLLLWGLVIGAGCTSDDLRPPVDCETEGPVIQVTESGDADCNEQNGFVDVQATGGVGDYQYSVDGGAPQSETLFEGLGAGTHTATVMDESGCIGTISFNISNKEGVNLALAATAAGCGDADGTITVTPEGGEGPYVFSIDDGEFQDASEFTNLSPGEYVVTVRDQTNCQSSQTVRVSSGISFATSIQPIITSSCAINDCHNGNQFPDFRVFKNIHENAANIKKLTGDRTMPDEGSLTQSQIDEIACWVDDGALQN